jgi:hypothetical protein
MDFEQWHVAVLTCPDIQLIKSEVEKDQLEADIRLEMVKEADQLILEATATYKQLAASAQEEADTLKRQVWLQKQHCNGQCLSAAVHHCQTCCLRSDHLL